MKFLFVGNWKMNPTSFEETEELWTDYKKIAQKFSRKGITVIGAPSMPHLGALAIAKMPKNLFLSAQDCFYENDGAFTGFSSPLAIYGVGADYVILGHSERRAAGETNELISKKINAALKAKLKPIVCVGEKTRDYEGEFWHELRKQIEKTLAMVSPGDASKLIIAYEPVWAIGEESRGSMKPNDLHETVLFIRKVLAHLYGSKIAKRIEILYGGSVFPENSHDLAMIDGVSGFLVGRASLDKNSITEILNEVCKR